MRVREISAEFRANMPPEWHGKTSQEIMDAIYDDDGLPICSDTRHTVNSGAAPGMGPI